MATSVFDTARERKRGRQAELRPISKEESVFARARQRQQEGLVTPLEEAGTVSKNIVTGAGRAMIGAIDTVGDVVKGLIGQLTPPGSPGGALSEEFQGAMSVSEQLKHAGIGLEEIPGTTARDIGTRAGEEAGLGAGVGGAATRAVGGIRRIAAPALKEAAEHPGRFVAAETVAGAGAGIGGELASPAGEAADIAGQLGGSVMPFALGRQIEGMLRVGSRARYKAGQRLKEEAFDPDLAIQNLGRTPEIEGLTLGQRTGDFGLLALERGITRMGVNQPRMLQQTEIMRDSVKYELERTLSPQSSEGARVAQEFMQGQIDTVMGQLDDRVSMATRGIDDRLSRLGPGTTRGAAQKVVQNELESLYSDVRVQEEELWNAVPSSVKVDRDQMVNAFKQGFPKERFLPRQVNLLPSDVTDLFRATRLDAAGKKVKLARKSVRELQAIRSDILDDARKAGVDSDFKKQRVYYQAADVLKGLMNAQAGVSAPLNAALKFSSVMNDRFRDGAVGKILGTSRGARPADATLALESILTSGPASGVAADELRKAQGDIFGWTPGERPAINENSRAFILDRFSREVVDKDLTARKVRDWRNNNQDLLRRFPDLDKRLSRLQKDRIELDDLVDQRSGQLKTLKQAQQGRFERFLQADPTNAIRVALGGPNPEQFTKFLLSKAREDPKGGALVGLKRGLMDDLFLQLDKNGVTTKNFKNYFSPAVKRAWRKVFTDDQMARVDVIGKELSRVDRSKQQLPGSATSENLSLMARLLARAGGGILGRIVPGGTLQVPQAAATGAQALAEEMTSKGKMWRLIEESVFNGDIGRDLMKTDRFMKRRAKNIRADFSKRLHGYLIEIDEEER